MAATITQPFTLTVTYTPALSGVNLSANTVHTSGPVNAGAIVGALSVVTNPPGGSTTGVVLAITAQSGPAGAPAVSFVLDATTLPANLKVGAANIPAGTYSVSVAATL